MQQKREKKKKDSHQSSNTWGRRQHKQTVLHLKGKTIKKQGSDF
jgi:hypothetical protein